jgi:hypothetical protein
MSRIDIDRELAICERATPGPVKWYDRAGQAVLMGDHGMRPYLLDCVRNGMNGSAFRVNVNDVMRKADAALLAEHPDTALIVSAFNHYPDLLRRFKRMRELITKDGISYQGFNEVRQLLGIEEGGGDGK